VRIVQLSDTHIFAAGGVTAANLERVAAYVNDELRPDLIVHTGDVCPLLPDREDDRAASFTAHEAFEAPVLFLPGNHDVGEPGDHPWMGLSVTSERLAAHRETFGADRFLHEDGPWVLIGLNSEVIGSGLPEEEEQWTWLADVAKEIGDREVILFLHKPLWSPLETEGDHQVALRDDERERLLAILAGSKLRAIGSGHLHRFYQEPRGEIVEIWAPSTAFVAGAEIEGLGFGTSVLGVVRWDLDDETREIGITLETPDGLETQDVRGIPELTEEFATISEGRDLLGARQ
jgi:3',5'-cyclic AMP phosphodiesterase CpdA